MPCPVQEKVGPCSHFPEMPPSWTERLGILAFWKSWACFGRQSKTPASEHKKRKGRKDLAHWPGHSKDKESLTLHIFSVRALLEESSISRSSQNWQRKSIMVVRSVTPKGLGRVAGRSGRGDLNLYILLNLRNWHTPAQMQIYTPKDLFLKHRSTCPGPAFTSSDKSFTCESSNPLFITEQ